MERYRTTIILVAVLIALGALAFFLTNQQGTGDVADFSTPTPDPTLLVWQESDQLVGIDVVSGTQRVVLRKDVESASWVIQEPISDTADTFVVSPVADNLQNLRATTVITDAQDLAQFGLDDPSLSVTATFSDTEGTRHTVLIGSATVDGSAYYGKRPDADTVYLIGNVTVEPLRSWLTSPPKAQPTPTPIPITVVPTSEVTPTTAGTAGPTEAPEPDPATTAPPEATAEPGAPTSTVTIEGTSPITNTAPGAANPTTPEATPTVP